MALSMIALCTMVLVFGCIHEVLQLTLVWQLDLHQPASTVWLLVDLLKVSSSDQSESALPADHVTAFDANVMRKQR